MRPASTRTCEWRPILGYEGMYEVSSDGRVRGLPRSCHVRSVPGKELKLSVNKGGYHVARLCKDGKLTSRTVHSLVLEAFVGPRPEGAVARHLDGDRLNNSPDNLAWGTISENQYDTVLHGNNHNAAKVRCKRGHLLVDPNLKRFPSDGHIRRRNCKSCWVGHYTARNRKQGGEESAIVTYSNMKYREMGLE